MLLPTSTRLEARTLALTGLLAAGAPLAATGAQIREPQIYLYNCGPQSCWVESDPNPIESREDLIIMRTEREGMPHSQHRFRPEEPVSLELRAGDTALLRPANPRANYLKSFNIARYKMTRWQDDIGRIGLSFQYQIIFRSGRVDAPPALVQIRPGGPATAMEAWLDYKLGRKATVLALAIENQDGTAQVPPHMLADDKALL